eukprot:g15985.t1
MLLRYCLRLARRLKRPSGDCKAFHKHPISFVATATPNPKAFKLEAIEDNSGKFADYLSFVHSNAMPRQFASPVRAAQCSRLAELILRVDGIESVFFGDAYLTLQISNDLDNEWETVESHVTTQLKHFFESYTVLPKRAINVEMDDNMSANCDTDSSLNLLRHPNQQLTVEIQQIIDEKVRPHVQADGGDVDFVLLDSNGVVHLRMLGACISCPSSTVTVRFMIKNMLQHYFEEVKDVEHVDWDE